MTYQFAARDERPLQRHRRLLAGLFASGLVMLSVSLELHLREINLQELLSGMVDAAVFIIDPNAPRPPIDLASLLRGLIAVVRNLVPALVMYRLTLLFSERLTQAIYGLSNSKEADDYLRSSLFGGVVGFGPFAAKLSTTLALERILGDLARSGPFVIVKEGEILGGELQPAARIGGPATLVIYNDSAVLLERAGRLTRVLGPGAHPLQRFEKIRSIIDLRPRWQQCTVKGMSREGIPANWAFDVHLKVSHLGQGRHQPRPEAPHAFSDEAVFKAATDDWILGPEQTDRLNWRDRVVTGEGEAILSSIMAKHTLDQLIQPLDVAQLLEANFDERLLRYLCFRLGFDYEKLPGQTKEDRTRTLVKRLEQQNRIQDLITFGRQLRPNVPWDESLVPPRPKIQQQFESALEKTAASHGADILAVYLRNVELEDPVHQQWLDTWRVKWESRRQVQLAKGKARGLRQIEKIKAEAQRDIIEGIIAGFRPIFTAKKPVRPEIVLMRFAETVRRFAAAPGPFPITAQPEQAVRTLLSLRNYFR
jgi:regulator of protease activity HflC (stomatin/prohibitin superfamily)